MTWKAVKRADGKWAVRKPLGTHGEVELASSLSESEARLIAAAPALLEALKLFQCIDFDLFSEHDELLLDTVQERSAEAISLTAAKQDKGGE